MSEHWEFVIWGCMRVAELVCRTLNRVDDCRRIPLVLGAVHRNEGTEIEFHLLPQQASPLVEGSFAVIDYFVKFKTLRICLGVSVIIPSMPDVTSFKASAGSFTVYTHSFQPCA